MDSADELDGFYIDCHCHLYDEQFSLDLDEVIGKAKSAGVKAAIVVSESFAQFPTILDLHKRFPDFIVPGLGVHPIQVGPSGNVDLSVPLSSIGGDVVGAIRANASNIVAIGECGLDFTPYYIKTDQDKDIQREVLKRQVDLSLELDLPLNVHSRSAGKHTIEFLAECGARNVVLHAFDGKPSAAQLGVDLGFYFSIPPSISRSKQKRNLAHRVPLESLLLETDSPCLGPEAQVRNEPSNVVISAAEIAQIKSVPVEVVRKQTTANAFKLFTKLKNFVKL